MAYTSKQIEKTKERLNDLRNEKGYILKQLSEELLKSQDISISHGMLGAYGETDREKKSYDSTASMSIDKFVALADFYKVPVDYLLGRIDTRKENNKDIGKYLGLSDAAIDNLREINNSDKEHASEKSYISRLDILDEILSSPVFLQMIENIAKAKECKLKHEDYELKTTIDTSYTEELNYSMWYELIQSGALNLPDPDYRKASKYYRHEAVDDFNYILNKLYEPSFTVDRPDISDEEDIQRLLSDKKLIKDLEAVAQECNFSSDSESEDEDIFDIEE